MLSYLHQWTGLSKSTITAGKWDQLQQATKDKIERHQQAIALATHGDDPQALNEVAELRNNVPLTRVGTHATLSMWMREFAFITCTDLSISEAVALVIDELVATLIPSCEADNLDDFRQALESHFSYHGVSIRLGSEPLFQQPGNEIRQQITLATTWEQMDRVVAQVVEHLFVDLLATLDAEWGAQFFTGCVPIALFPLVMVKPREGLLENLDVTNKRNLFKRPSRRLLEFLYAVAYYTKNKNWPPHAPMPAEIAKYFESPGDKAMADKGLISSYFDGTTALSLELIESQWNMMIRTFHEKADGGDTSKYDLPFPLAVVALLFQRIAVQTKPNKTRTFFVLDTTVYDVIWEHRRQQWESTPTGNAALEKQAGQAKRDPIAWPVWLLNQSSSSSV